MRSASISALQARALARATSLFSRFSARFTSHAAEMSGPPDLADLRLVDVHVDDPGARRKAGDGAGGPVVESHPQGDEQVGAVHRDVRCPASVHAQHAEVQRVVRAP